MCYSSFRRCYQYIDNRFIDFSLYIDEQVCDRTLLDIPLKYWRWFKCCTYLHFLFSIVLLISGVICFTLGVEYSIYYTTVNCSNGLNVWPPVLNLVSSVFGMVTLRTLNMRWPAFIHITLLITALPFVLASVISSSIDVERWENQPIVTAPSGMDFQTETSLVNNLLTSSDTNNDVYIENIKILPWRDTFIGIDSSLVVLSSLNLTVVVILIIFYLRWWCRKVDDEDKYP